MATFSLADITGDHRETPITTYIDCALTDNKRRYREEVPVAPPSPVKRHRAGLTQTATIPTQRDNEPTPDAYEPYQMGLGADDATPAPAPAPRPRNTKPSDPALARFRFLRDRYLANMLRRDGCIWCLGADVCFGCRALTDHTNPKLFRCKSCYGDKLFCEDCMVARHSSNPLHRIERWNGQFFEPTTLKALGLHVQLGHPPNERCSEPHALHSSFVVLHINGIHEVAVDSCDCEHRLWAGPLEEQLQRHSWFPATDEKPRTCATFEVLDNFVTLTYQAKTTMYDYCTVLEKLTNNAGVKPPYRYHAFLRMVRKYSHLLMLKRAGRGHAMLGVMATGQGELAVKCPCCPRPGENLPDDWEDAPPGAQFLYIMFVAIDACFRLKRRLVSSESKDPTLGSGWSYMVESASYREYLLSVTDQKEMSTCSGLAALDYTNSKFSRGYSATSVGVGVCARHEFVQPNGVGDLQKGERVIWQLLRFAIPKMHIKGHRGPCGDTYLLNIILGSAQTNGEGIERPWAHIGGVGTSTREMGPGSREDTLNAHWGSWNWQKLVALGEQLRTKLDRAKEEYAAQSEAFTEFSQRQAERIPGWREMVEKFEQDPGAKNPYEMKMQNTWLYVLLGFEKEEAERVKASVPRIHAVSPSSFVSGGLEVEDEQYVALKKAGTTAQEIDIAGLRRSLNRSIQRLRTLQATYTPAAILSLAQRENVPVDKQLEHVPLFLPSGLTAAQRVVEGVDVLATMEKELRHAQCATALERLRNQLHVKSRFLTYKELQARHQGANMRTRTRTRTLVTRNESKIQLHSEKYQMSWEALRRLVGGDVQAVGWHVLLKADIRCMDDAEEVAKENAKRKTQKERRKRCDDFLCDDFLRGEGELGVEEEGEGEGENGETGTTGTDADLEEGDVADRVVQSVRRTGVTLEARAWEWESRAREVPVEAEKREEWERTAPGVGAWTVERAEGAIAYALKEAVMYRGIAGWLTVLMTEERRGRGKKRRLVNDDKWLEVEGDGDDEEDEAWRIARFRADEVADDDFILYGGADED
ncbi:hypothetical protein K438DRAFT_1957172 [Mycena galopus ATCC 62051]|nr:hypothetical protein K438DRAFT_1957172 [Mycena galopus ATCC 62051]